MNKTALIAALASAATVIAMPAAFAHDRYEHISNDDRHIERDRAQVAADEAKLRQEYAELNEARHHRRWASWHGWGWRAHQAQHQVHRERSEIEALERKIARERAGLNCDLTDVRRDHGRRSYRDAY